MKAILSVVVMAVVTYGIRVIPLAVCQKEIESRFVKSFLFYVPYAVLASLTFPAIFWSTGNTMTATVGTLAALLLAYFEQSLVVVAVAAIVVVYGCSFIM